MQRIGTIRKFETKNFIVRVTAEDEFDSPDLSWDDSGEVARKLETGEFIRFCAHAEVIHKGTGAVLGEDYLGDCIYESLQAFEDHRECGKQNREYAAKGDEGRCGSYFSDMIHEAIAQARKLQSLKLRKAA